MEIYLNTNDQVFRLPVLPSEYSRETKVNLDTQAVKGLGDVALYTSNGLTAVAIECFFPNQEYSFVEYKPVPTPLDCVGYLNNCKNKGIPVRVIITGVFNQLMLVESFSYGEKDGTGDIYYTLSLVEYREITIPKIKINSTNNIDNNNRPTENKPVNNTQRTYKVKRGDYLAKISKMFYGTENRWREISKANYSKYPSLKKNNLIYSNWELIIP